MILSTSNYLNPQADKSIGQKINSFKINFNSMAHVIGCNDPVTQCHYCKGVLIDEDKKNHVEKDEKGLYKWFCRFCKKENRSQQMYFVSNNHKFTLEKKLKTKITPPIILFLIDNSGSMSQSIFSNIKHSNNPNMIQDAKNSLHVSILELVSKSTLYKREKQMISKLESSFKHVVKNSKYREQEVSKLVFLYALIEHNLNMLSEKNKKMDYRVGFIFFSDMLYVLKGAKQKEIPVYVQRGELCHEEWPYQKEALDFYQYEEVYETGRKYEKYFGDSRIHKFDVSKVAVSKAKGGGRTALGPALALAMGIISMHDQGSRIIVATDSIPNFGMLSVGDGDHIYGKIGQCLQDNNCTLSILKWSGDDSKSKQDQFLTKFKNHFSQHVEQIELNLNKCKGNEALQLSFLSLSKLMTRQPMGHSCQIKILCDNPKMVPQKLPFNQLDYSSIRFLNSKSRCWLTMSIKSKALQQYDYLFPVITQAITTYADLFTKQRYIFVSYIKQQLSQSHRLPPTDKEDKVTLDDEEVNMDNINQLCDLEFAQVFEKSRHSQDMQQFKTTFKYKNIDLEKSMSNISMASSSCQLLQNEEEYEYL